MSHVEGVARNPYLGYLVNVLGAIRVAHAAIEVGARRFVFASSATVYGEVCSGLLTESSPTDATTLYAETKLLAEQNLRLLSQSIQMELVILRLAHLYGPGQASDRSVPSLILQSWRSSHAEGGKGSIQVPISSGRIPSDDFVFVADAADAFLKAAATPLSGKTAVFNISSGLSTSLLSVAEMAASVMSVDANLQFVEQAGYWSRALDNQRAARELNWVPGTALQNGLEITASGYENVALVDAVRED
jgi:UDP-glucose 4-epimerase